MVTWVAVRSVTETSKGALQELAASIYAVMALKWYNRVHQRLANFFYKGTDSKYICHNYSILPLQHERAAMVECVWMGSVSLFTDTEI